jgi:hypothetical protein
MVGLRMIVTALALLICSGEQLIAQGNPGLIVQQHVGRSYSTAAALYTGYASPTDFFAIRGSATKIIKIIKIRLSGYATANNIIDLALVKRSTANTSGTPTTLTNVPLDSVNPAATAVAVTYAAAPTVGTLVGNICACQVELPAKSGVGGYILRWDFWHNGGGPVILRGTNEMATLNAYGTSFPAGTNLNITLEWIEE